MLLVAICAGVEYYRDRDFLAYFRDHKGRLVVVDESPAAAGGDHALHHVTLRDDRGLEVHGVLKVPAGESAPRAAIIALGGLRSGAHALDYVRDTGDFVVLVLDFPFDGKRSRLSTGEFLRQVPAMRRALVDTPPATMLAVDYLRARPEVDPDRVVLLAGSLGALVAPAVAAADERISALVLLFGAGDLNALMRANLPGPRVLRPPIAWFLSALTAPIEPLKYIGRVTPRPVFMLNGTGDARMPERCARRLHDAAGEPAAIRWIDAGHVSIRDSEFQRLVLEDVRGWLAGLGLAEPGPARAR